MSKLISINDIRENMIVLINTNSSSERLYFAKVIEVTNYGVLRVRSFLNLEIESVLVDEINIIDRIRICSQEEVSRHLRRKEALFKFPITIIISERKEKQSARNKLIKGFNIKLAKMTKELEKIIEKEELERRILKRNMDYLRSLENI